MENQIQQQNFCTVRYMAEGLMRGFKVSLSNPRDFKVGDKYIVIGQSTKPQIVSSEHNAKNLNESIISGNNIRKFIQ